jgi:hypothetical protein
VHNGQDEKLRGTRLGPFTFTQKVKNVIGVFRDGYRTISPPEP